MPGIWSTRSAYFKWAQRRETAIDFEQADSDDDVRAERVRRGCDADGLSCSACVGSAFVSCAHVGRGGMFASSSMVLYLWRLLIDGSACRHPARTRHPPRTPPLYLLL